MAAALELGDLLGRRRPHRPHAIQGGRVVRVELATDDELGRSGHRPMLALCRGRPCVEIRELIVDPRGNVVPPYVAADPLDPCPSLLRRELESLVERTRLPDEI